MMYFDLSLSDGKYLPTALDVLECLWCFSIPSLSLPFSFLLVGLTVEPAVHLDHAYVSFKSMLLGGFLN